MEFPPLSDDERARLVPLDPPDTSFDSFLAAVNAPLSDGSLEGLDTLAVRGIFHDDDIRRLRADISLCEAEIALATNAYADVCAGALASALSLRNVTDIELVKKQGYLDHELALPDDLFDAQRVEKLQYQVTDCTHKLAAFTADYDRIWKDQGAPAQAHKVAAERKLALLQDQFNMICMHVTEGAWAVQDRSLLAPLVPAQPVSLADAPLAGTGEPSSDDNFEEEELSSWSSESEAEPAPKGGRKRAREPTEGEEDAPGAKRVARLCFFKRYNSKKKIWYICPNASRTRGSQECPGCANWLSSSYIKPAKEAALAQGLSEEQANAAGKAAAAPIRAQAAAARKAAAQQGQ
jgi:hypothetical protein